MTLGPRPYTSLQSSGQRIPGGLLVFRLVGPPDRMALPSTRTVSTSGEPGGITRKVAVTDWSCVMRTVHLSMVPRHAPPHSAKRKPSPCVAVSVIGRPSPKGPVEQVGGQLINPPSPLTVPFPL